MTYKIKNEVEMKTNSIIVTLLLMFVLIAIGCSDDGKKDNVEVITDFEDIQVHDQFNYSTTKIVTVSLTVLNGSGDGVNNIPFKVFDKAPKEGGVVYESGATNEDGKANLYVTIPDYMEELYIEGYMSSLTLPIVNNAIIYEFGTDVDSEERGAQEIVKPERAGDLEYVLSYSRITGIPYGMSKDTIPREFLRKVNATLPEGKPVPQFHPHYLNPNNELNVVVINEPAEVWVTFVHEGAGYKNSLGYYTYQEGNPPQTRDDIDTIKVIFPNVSMRSSIFTNGLVPGDKVYLGKFEAGTVIGWVLMANGWYNGRANLVENSWFSDKNLNPSNYQQSIMAYDNEFKKLLFSFEDLVYDKSDKDFNDAVFYVTATPIESIDIGNIPPVDTPEDKDGDGISDIFDDFPDDPERAFHTNNNGRSSLVFEDLWPAKGDYDFNDMVIDYNMFFHKNAGGKITNVLTEFELRATGARFRNGFAVQFPFSSSNVASMTVIDGNDDLTYSTVVSDKRFSPILEDGDKAVIIFIPNTNELMAASDEHFVNTQADAPYINPVIIALDIKLDTPEDMADWAWGIPFNPFIYINGNRGHEVHLPDYPPTSLADQTLFGLNDDSSDATQNRYYKTINNHPWGLNIAESFDYPYEKAKINHAYKKFKAWAEDSGASYEDWFKNLPGYRNDDLIYQKP